MQTSDPSFWTLREATDNLRARRISSVDLTTACLDRIRTFNPKTNAFITVLREQALAQAKALDKEQASGRLRGPLHGIPIALKDNVDLAGVRTTAGSKTLAGNIATEDAEVTRRLRAAGAVLVGKCNMHIFAAGATSAVSYYGPVRNPWNLELIAGGSSGGSAAAVAMHNCFAAIGTDTGGSIRTPAAMCGVTGFKATYGRVSIRGIVPLTWSLDHCGPLARTVEDTVTVLQAIAGYDNLDLQSVDCAVPDYVAALTAPVAQFRLGIAPQFFDGLDADVASALDSAIAQLTAMTKGAKEVELPSILGTGANSEGGVYREALGNGFLRGGAEVPGAPSITFTNGAPSASSAARWISKFSANKRSISWSPRPSANSRGPSRRNSPAPPTPARATPNPATRAPSTTTACRPSPCPAVSRKPVCPSACSSAAPTGERPTSSPSPRLSRRPPTGTPAGPRSRPTQRCRCCQPRQPRRQGRALPVRAHAGKRLL